MVTRKLRRLLWLVPGALLLIIGAMAWDVFLLPSSIAEALFRYRLSGAAEIQKKEIDLAELAAFEWAEVCFHHPYDGEFKYPKYGRTYHAPMNAAQDEVWSLLFIGKDGSPTYVSGSCRRGGADIEEFGCLSRERAVLRLTQPKGCPTYAAS